MTAAAIISFPEAAPHTVLGPGGFPVGRVTPGG